MGISTKVKEKAFKLGFDLVGITSAESLEDGQREVFERWLRAGFAGQMGYMHRNLDKRVNPEKLLEGAKSVIVVGLNYKLPAEIEEITGANEPCGKVARYARYEDYHVFFRRLLHQLGEYLCDNTGDDTRYKVCVDSVPLAERAFAVRAGLGFIGKNHMLISPNLGPEIILGEVITNLKLESDEPNHHSCAGCDKCIKACPTGALTNQGWFDASRCISYLTIEHKGRITGDLSQKIRGRIFGCDECVLACPYQQKAPECKNISFRYYPDRANLSLNEVEGMSEEEFSDRLGDSPMFHTGLEMLKRNGRICFQNLKY